MSIPIRHLEVVLPIGISFYTFQSMSYVIDVYRREIAPTRNLVQFATFVSFFPHLVAGPIMRPTVAVAASRLEQAVRPATVLRRLVPDLLGLAQEGRHRRQPGGDRDRPLRPLGRRSTAAWPCWRSTPLPSRSTATSRATPTSPAAWPSAWASSFRSTSISRTSRRARETSGPAGTSASRTWLRDYLYIPAGGQPRRPASDLPQPDAHDDHWAASGTAPPGRSCCGASTTASCWSATGWQRPGSTRIQPADPVDRACWKALRIVVTFHLVCLGWLFFRAESMEQALGHARRDRPPSRDSGWRRTLCRSCC